MVIRECNKMLFNGKKGSGGINDVVIFFGLILFFVLLGSIMPYINLTFGSDTAIISYNNATSLLPGALPQQDTNIVTVAFSWLNVIFSIFTMFFWSFGNLPVWVDVVFIPIRITLFILGYRLIRHGGG